jgi:hypothetical protein
MKAHLSINNDDMQFGITKSLSMRIGLCFILNILLSHLAHAEVDCDQVTEIPKEECNTLVELYNNTNGPS